MDESDESRAVSKVQGILQERYVRRKENPTLLGYHDNNNIKLDDYHIESVIGQHQQENCGNDIDMIDIKLHKKVIFQSETGQGRSTLFSTLCLEWANKKSNNSFLSDVKLLFHVPLRHLYKDPVSMIDLIDQSGLISREELTNSEQEDLVKYIAHHPDSVLFVLDGLDQLRVNLHSAVLRFWKSTFLAEIPIIMTITPQFQKILQMHSIVECCYELKGLKQTEYLKTLNRKKDILCSDRLLAKIQECNEAILRNPTFLTLLCMDNDLGNNSPLTRTSIMKKSILIWIKISLLKPEQSVRFDSIDQLPENVKDALLQLGKFAFENTAKRQFSFTLADIVMTIKGDTFGLLRCEEMSSSLRRWSFLHSLVQEFLAALWFVSLCPRDKRSEAFVEQNTLMFLNNTNIEYMSNVSLFICGLLSDHASPFLIYLCSLSDGVITSEILNYLIEAVDNSQEKTAMYINFSDLLAHRIDLKGILSTIIHTRQVTVLLELIANSPKRQTWENIKAVAIRSRILGFQESRYIAQLLKSLTPYYETVKLLKAIKVLCENSWIRSIVISGNLVATEIAGKVSITKYQMCQMQNGLWRPEMLLHIKGELLSDVCISELSLEDSVKTLRIFIDQNADVIVNRKGYIKRYDDVNDICVERHPIHEPTAHVSSAKELFGEGTSKIKALDVEKNDQADRYTSRDLKDGGIIETTGDRIIDGENASKTNHLKTNLEMLIITSVPNLQSDMITNDTLKMHPNMKCLVLTAKCISHEQIACISHRWEDHGLLCVVLTAIGPIDITSGPIQVLAADLSIFAIIQLKTTCLETKNDNHNSSITTHQYKSIKYERPEDTEQKRMHRHFSKAAAVDLKKVDNCLYNLFPVVNGSICDEKHQRHIISDLSSPQSKTMRELSVCVPAFICHLWYRNHMSI